MENAQKLAKKNETFKKTKENNSPIKIRIKPFATYYIKKKQKEKKAAYSTSKRCFKGKKIRI